MRLDDPTPQSPTFKPKEGKENISWILRLCHLELSSIAINEGIHTIFQYTVFEGEPTILLTVLAR
jgi:hypothetical protein